MSDSEIFCEECGDELCDFGYCHTCEECMECCEDEDEDEVDEDEES